MNARRQGTGARPVRQRGFTLLEVSVVLALLGVLAAITFKSQELVEQYRQAQFVNHVRLLQAHVVAYKTAFGRLPGDCNRDGLMDAPFVSASALNAEVYDYGIPSELTAAASVSTTYALGLLCPASTLAPFAHFNVAWNELKWGGQTPSGEPNRKASAHGLGGFAFLGVFNINPGLGRVDDRFNAIVLTDVPIVAARRLAVALEGSDGPAANLNRVRRSDDLLTFAPLWTATGETELKRITVVVFFDRIPP